MTDISICATIIWPEWQLCLPVAVGGKYMQKTEDRISQIISMERLHEIVNAGGLSGLCTGGVVCGTDIRDGEPDGEYTLWKLEYIGGHREQWYTRN